MPLNAKLAVDGEGPAAGGRAGGPSSVKSSSSESYAQSDANIHNFAPVARIMKGALPENAKIAKEAKECMQECVSEFISFITSEGSFEIPKSVLSASGFTRGGRVCP